MLPKLPNIEDYQVSADNGFLPVGVPLARLPDPYYRAWELVVARLHSLISEKRIRTVVDDLPVLSISRLRSEAEWRRAYVVLGFISNAYIWGMEQAKDRLPQCLSIPFLGVSEHLEVPPVVTYAGCCLWNFRPVLPTRPIDDPENLESLCTFTDTVDEQWFYLVSVAIEARGAPTIPLMIEAMHAARQGDSVTVNECLTIFSNRMQDLQELLSRMHERLSPQAFYFHIRPFLAGSKNMAEAGLPHGVLFEDGTGNEQYRQYSGGSNAQSSLIQFFDIALGVEHWPTGVKKNPTAEKLAGAAPPPRHNFIEEMRLYMPGPHRRFLEDLASVANIRDYVDANRHDPALTAAYDECLRSLTDFRDTHLRIVSRYIVIMAQQSKKHLAGDSVYRGATQNVAYVDMNGTEKGAVLGLAKDEASKKGLKGTGGTKLMPFLKQSRDETMEPANKPRSKVPSKFEGLPIKLNVNAPVRSPTRAPKNNSSIDDQYAVRWCKVNDFEDFPPARIMGVGMAGTWEVGDDYGGICHC